MINAGIWCLSHLSLYKETALDDDFLTAIEE